MKCAVMLHVLFRRVCSQSSNQAQIMQMNSNVYGLFHNKIAGHFQCPLYNAMILLCTVYCSTVLFKCPFALTLKVTATLRLFLSGAVTWSLFSTGPVLSRPGTVPLQRGEHDRVQAAQHRQSSGGLGGGEVGHGATAGAHQSRDRNDGGDDDGEFASFCHFNCCVLSGLFWFFFAKLSFHSYVTVIVSTICYGIEIIQQLTYTMTCKLRARKQVCS